MVNFVREGRSKPVVEPRQNTPKGYEVAFQGGVVKSWAYQLNSIQITVDTGEPDPLPKELTKPLEELR